jgi:hypothetical protein
MRTGRRRLGFLLIFLVFVSVVACCVSHSPALTQMNMCWYTVIVFLKSKCLWICLERSKCELMKEYLYWYSIFLAVFCVFFVATLGRMPRNIQHGQCTCNVNTVARSHDHCCSWNTTMYCVLLSYTSLSTICKYWVLHKNAFKENLCLLQQ